MAKRPSLTVQLEPDGSLSVPFPGHSIRLPATEDGLRVLTKMLAAQGDMHAPSTIGFDSNPTQWLVEEWLKEHGAGAGKVATRDRETLTGIGLEL